jgi:integrase
VSSKGFIYRRAGTICWWVTYFDEKGKRRQVSSGSDDEAFARRCLASIERKVAAARSVGIDLEELTVEKFAERWLKDRELRGVASWKDDKGRLAHALPVLGQKPIENVKPGDVRSFMAELRARGELAPRTVRHVYGVLRVMFSDALAEELIRSTPCILKERRGEIPKKQDADLSWRDGAVFTRPEVERLIFDPRVPADRRTIYALLFLGGMRIGEVAARTWADWNRDVHPLTGLSVLTSFNRKLKKVKGVKTDRPRYVPVHPVLAAALSEWLELGWEQQHGRRPEPHDLIVPSRTGKHLRDPVVLERLQADLATLGLRARRVHDARRTFVSLLLADGADREKVRWVSHGPPGDILGSYTSLPWDSLCAEVTKLKLVTVQLQRQPTKEKASKVQDLGGQFNLPKAGFEAEQPPPPGDAPNRPATQIRTDALGPTPQRGGLTRPSCNSVTDPADLLDQVRAWAALPSKLERARSPLLPSVEKFFASQVAADADPSGAERAALLEGFIVSPPWDLLTATPDSIH